MRGFLIVLLLLLNVAYLGHEISQDRQMHRSNSKPPLAVPADAVELMLISELRQPPEPLTPPTGPKPIPAQTTPAGETATAQQTTQHAPIHLVPLEREHTPAPVTEISALAPVSPSSSTPPPGDNTIPSPPACFRYGPMETAMEQRTLVNRLRIHMPESSAVPWSSDAFGRRLLMVFLPVSGGDKTLRQHYHELQQRGIQDIRILTDANPSHPHGQGISLGIFSSRDAVNRRLRTITRLGYAPDIVPYTSRQSQYWTDIRLQNAAIDRAYEGLPSDLNAVPIACDSMQADLNQSETGFLSSPDS